MDIIDSANWKDILAYYQVLKDECRERRLSTNPQLDQLSQAQVICREEIGNGYPISHNPLRGLCTLSLRIKVAHTSFRLFDGSNFTRTDEKTSQCLIEALCSVELYNDSLK